jgi:hypothetical protein
LALRKIRVVIPLVNHKGDDKGDDNGRRHSVPSAPGKETGSFGGVIVAGAFLAEGASVVDNKLNVTGGVLYRFLAGPDRSAQFVLVVLTQTETDNPDRRLDVEIRPPTDDEPLRLTVEVPEAAVHAEIGFAYFSVEVTLPVDGRWVIVVSGGSGAISLPLMVSGA